MAEQQAQREADGARATGAEAERHPIHTNLEVSAMDENRRTAARAGPEG